MTREDVPSGQAHDALIDEWVDRQDIPTGPLPARAVQVLAALDANRPATNTDTEQGGAA